MNKPIFITGIGTGVGKTVVAAIVAEALKADYWKPVQAGYENGTDTLLMQELISNNESKVHHEFYKLALPASPHIAADKGSVNIELDVLERAYRHLSSVNQFLIIESSGGLLAPLNETEFVIDLIEKLEAQVILVSRNYLGSINHSLLTAQLCKQRNIDVIGWVFNDKFMEYEEDIVKWSGYPSIATLPIGEVVDKEFVSQHAEQLKQKLESMLKKKEVKKRTSRKTKNPQE